MSQAAAQANGDPNDVRPVVRTAGTGQLGVWIFGALVLAAGFALFLTLNTRRQELAAPATTATLPGTGGGMIAAPPPLSLPQAYPEPLLLEPPPRARAVFPSAGPVAQPQTVTRYIERPSPLPSSNGFAQLSPPASVPVTLPAVPPPPAAPSFDPEERVSASRLANPSMTIPKGTIVAAVLETALDSSRAGAVRAIVSRDVRSFDGSRVLIPRGSRLYGEYASDVSAGQKRAMIEWQRLLRPDGVTIELASPSADPLGRAGVEGRVHSNFFARFGGAILQSVLDMGVALATGAVLDDAVIVNLPPGAQQVTGDALPPPPQPRLTVRQGTSVSVFVARDLDFASVGG